MADERGAADRAKDKLERGAVDELEYDEITDIFELIGARVRDSTERACDEGFATAEVVKSLTGRER